MVRAPSCAPRLAPPRHLRNPFCSCHPLDEAEAAPWTAFFPNTSSMRSVMPSATRGVPIISSAAIGRERSFVIDTGFTAEVAAARGRRHLRCPAESLGLVGLDRNTVADVILTHIHYDHVGTFHHFPAAQFHLQEVELHYTTGRHMRHPFLARSFEVE